MQSVYWRRHKWTVARSLRAVAPLTSTSAAERSSEGTPAEGIPDVLGSPAEDSPAAAARSLAAAAGRIQEEEARGGRATNHTQSDPHRQPQVIRWWIFL